MIEKLKTTIKNNKSSLIVMGTIWVILLFVFIAPLTQGIIDATKPDGSFVLKTCIMSTMESIKQPFSALGVSFSSIENIGLFFSNTLKFTVCYIALVVTMLIMAKPNNEYKDIEYGSSDWCTNGEQYRILNPKEGILLAEKNYLPLDKRGNTNILVIRRFWSG